MFNFLLLMVLPTLMAIGAMLYFKGKVTYLEFFGQIGAVALVVALGFGVSYWSGTADTEVWNGQITAKQPQVPVSCEHSYQCNPHPCNCDSKGHCSTCYDTCYEHHHDYDWDLAASTGELLSIDRIDRQGLDMPPRWAAAYVGEPYSSQHTFTNYIKVNPDSVLLGTKGDMQRWGKLVPSYNDKIYDYYYHDPVLNMGVPGVDAKVWNWLIREVNKQLGPVKQVNVIVILVPANDRSYMYALKDAWLGGKKNDVVMVIGSQDGHQVGFADVMSWSTNKALGVDLKNRIQDIGSLDRRDDIQQAILATVKAEFVRMHMHDMKWLMRSFQPSGAAMLWLFILALLVEGGLAYWTVTNNIRS